MKSRIFRQGFGPNRFETLTCWVYIGKLAKRMETLGPFKGIYTDVLGLYWGYIGLMEEKMETTIMGLYRV